MTVTDPVKMPFSLQDPFNFNVEISVSWCGCRYHDPAGFRPRMVQETLGSPAMFGRSNQSMLLVCQYVESLVDLLLALAPRSSVSSQLHQPANDEDTYD